MTQDWREWRPAIWLAMLGVAVMLLLSPYYLGVIFVGGAIGVAIRIHQRRRRRSAAAASEGRRPGEQRPGGRDR